MEKQQRDNKLMLILGTAGFLSGLVTICVAYPIGHHRFPFFPGAIFGVVVSTFLALIGYLRSLWKILAIIAACTVAYFVSFLAAGAVALHNPFDFSSPVTANGLPSSAALFAGGLAGAFMVISVVSPLLSGLTWQRQALKALYWSPVGGVLAIAGSWLGPTLGMALWSITHSLGFTARDETIQNALGATSHMYSIWIVWQNGICIVIGIVSNESGRNANTGRLASRQGPASLFDQPSS
jgi:hypothetical protein